VITWLQLNPDEGASVAKSHSSEGFAVPDSLRHHYVIVPSKLRLVVLAAFLIWKCNVSLRKLWMFPCVELNEKSVEFLLDQC